MKTARMAPSTDSAPFMPHAHATSWGRVAASSLTPAGSGMPITIPAGVISATASARRSGSGQAIAAWTIAGSTLPQSSATTATAQHASDRRAPHMSVADSPAQHAAQARAEQQ